MELDDIDRRILGVLLEDGRATWQDLADRVGLGPSATRDRVRRLERDGVITGYRAEIAQEASGRPLEARVAVTVGVACDRDAVVAAFVAQPAVVDAVHLTGPDDYELTVRCRDIDELDSVLFELKRHGVERSHTRVVLDRVVRRPPTPVALRTPDERRRS